MSMATFADEGVRIDILLLLHKEGPSTKEILTRRLGISQDDHLDWNLKRLSGFVLSSGNRLELTEAGEHRVKVEILKETED